MNIQNPVISTKMDVDIKPVIHHPLLSASVTTGSDSNAVYAEDEEDDDDDSDDDMMQNSKSGVYTLGFPKSLSFNSSFGTNLCGIQSTGFPSIGSSQCSVPMTSQVEVYTLSSPSKSVDKVPVSSLGQARHVKCLPFSNTSLSFTSPSTVSLTQTPSTPVNHIRLIRPNVPQPTTGGVIKVVNTPSSDSSVRIICLVDQNTSKTTPNVITQSGKSNIFMSQDMLNANVSHGLTENIVLSPESMYPTSSSGAQMLPQKIAAAPSESVPLKVINNPIQPIRPKPDSSSPLVCIAPRPPRLVQLTSSTSIYENTVSPQPILSSPGGNRMYISSSYPVQQTPVGGIRPSNSPVLIDNRPVVFASTPTHLTPPQVQSPQPQSIQRFSVIAPKSAVQLSTNQTYVQILPRPTVTTVQTRSPGVTVLKPFNQSKVPVDSVGVTSQNISNRQVIVSNVYNDGLNNNNNVLNPCGVAPVSVTSSFSNYDLNQRVQNVIINQEVDTIQSPQPPSTYAITGTVVSTSTNLSSVKIQDDLCLTESQLSVVQSLFQGANRVTRPEKAMIISFIAGSRDNPRPDTGQTTRIRLSEHRERVLNQSTGQLMDLAVDTYLTMDYSTGKYEKAKDTSGSGFIGPLTQAEYEQLYPRTDKPDLLAEVAAEENEWIEFERLDEKEAVQAGTAAWAPLKPPFIDSHFSIWSLSESISASQLYLGGKLPPPPSANWAKVLRRDYTADDYEEEMNYMRLRAENEMRYEVGELAPVRYAIHVQVASTYSESLMISSLAEDYYCIAGYVGWCDLSDPSLQDHIQQMSHDPLLVGLRYDVSEMEGDYLLESMIDSNISAIEHQQLVFDLAIGPHQLRHACHLAYRHPKLKLVLNHCGLPVEFTASRPGDNLAWKNWRSDLELLSRYPNVYCKVTGATGRIQKPSKSYDESSDVYSTDQWCASSALSHAISCFGPDRCLFGSGWPVCRLFKPDETGWPEQASASDLQTYDIPGELAAKRSRGSVPLKVLNLWEAARLVEYAMGEAGYGSVEDKEKIFSTNAQNVYSLCIRPYGSCPRYKAKE
ncbi:unnamed protein product [Heterobilharzia americana]|nr:unnamed protein product [Heterobilharzia americana]